MNSTYLEPSEDSITALLSRNIRGEVVMLNLLKFKEKADYSDYPELAPSESFSGREAFQRYFDHTLPYLLDSGGEVMYLGDCSNFFIGPADEQWDMLMMIRQASLESFFSFASNEEYLAGIGHRTAALEDSRLLPVTPT